MVEEKVERGIYSFEECPCFCGSSDELLLATRDYYGFFYPLVACRRCGLMRPNPRMTVESYAEFYNKEYRSAYGENDDQLDRYFLSTLREGERLYGYVQKCLGPAAFPKVAFEIGCNMGAMLVPWRRAGCEVFGADYNRCRIEEGRRRTGIETLYVGGIEKLGGTGEKADLIILNHVFEHFLHLDGDLKTVKALLNPGGNVYIAVPGTYWWITHVCGGDIMGLLQNAHTYQFSLATLRYVMGCCGFEFVHGDEQIVSLFRATEAYASREDFPEAEFELVLKYLRRKELTYTPKRFAKRMAEFLGVREMFRRDRRDRR